MKTPKTNNKTNKNKTTKPTTKRTSESKTKKNKESPFPEFQVIKYKENKDGSATINYEVNDAFIQLAEKDLNQTNLTARQINKWVLNVLEKAVKGKDGYGFVTEKKEKERKERGEEWVK